MSEPFEWIRVFVTDDDTDDDPHVWFVCERCGLSDGHAMPDSVPVPISEFARWSMLFANVHARCTARIGPGIEPG